MSWYTHCAQMKIKLHFARTRKIAAIYSLKSMSFMVLCLRYEHALVETIIICLGQYFPSFVAVTSRFSFSFNWIRLFLSLCLCLSSSFIFLPTFIHSNIFFAVNFLGEFNPNEEWKMKKRELLCIEFTLSVFDCFAFIFFHLNASNHNNSKHTHNHIMYNKTQGENDRNLFILQSFDSIQTRMRGTSDDDDKHFFISRDKQTILQFPITTNDCRATTL